MVDFRVRVITAKQQPVEGVRVVMEFTKLTLDTIRRVFTDTNGYAHFEEQAEGEVNISVMGTKYGTYQCLNGTSITVVI